MKSGEMYTYYMDKKVLPTFGNFKDEGQLLKYEQDRAFLFNKLKVPEAYFRGATIVEFGPDTGENALVFCRWGSQIYFVEPNSNSAAQRRDYFERFGLTKQILGDDARTLQEFRSNQQFNMVVAEGFLHTMRPNSLWLKKFNSLLFPGGLFLFSYLETAGSVIELFHKVIYQFVSKRCSEDSVTLAKNIFQIKWDSIPHTRSFESWYIDVIKNPYVRYRYLNNAQALLRESFQYDFLLYSSWPVYDDANYVAWHKFREPPEVLQDRILKNVQRATLSYFFGKKCYYFRNDSAVVEHLPEMIDQLVMLLDTQIDSIDITILKKINRLLTDLVGLLRLDGFAYDVPLEFFIDRVEMMSAFVTHMVASETEKLLQLCQESRTFIDTWGMPNHMALLQKKGEL